MYTYNEKIETLRWNIKFHQGIRKNTICDRWPKGKILQYNLNPSNGTSGKLHGSKTLHEPSGKILPYKLKQNPAPLSNLSYIRPPLNIKRNLRRLKTISQWTSRQKRFSDPQSKTYTKRQKRNRWKIHTRQKTARSICIAV